MDTLKSNKLLLGNIILSLIVAASFFIGANASLATKLSLLFVGIWVGVSFGGWIATRSA